MPLLSIICPVYNEKNHISSLANIFLFSDGIDKEVIFVDGGSDDGSIEKINEIVSNHSNVKLINNPKKYVSFGFNLAYKQTKGKYIALLGAHAEYPKNYFNIGISSLERNECDVVGGPLKQIGNSHVGKAISYCLSSKFGVGNTEFRVYKERMFVDSVAFAIYNRKVFEGVGLLDEDLIRNQDDELHYRINNAGFKILMIPEMQSVYYVRDSLRGLTKQYFNYGLYKPLVLKKIKKIVSLRHFIPSLFVLYLLSLPLSIYFTPWLIPLILYVLADIYYAMKAPGSLSEKMLSLLAFPLIHISYGLGFILGLGK